MMLYNEKRDFFMTLEKENTDNIKELFDIIHAFEPFAGRKGYLKAKVIKEGELFIAAEPIFVCKW